MGLIKTTVTMIKPMALNGLLGMVATFIWARIRQLLNASERRLRRAKSSGTKKVKLRLSCVTNIALVLLMMLLPATSQHHTLEPKCEALEAPERVQRDLKDSRDLKLSCRVKPPLIRGDFDGDGAPDYAVLVTNKANAAARILML